VPGHGFADGSAQPFFVDPRCDPDLDVHDEGPGRLVEMQEHLVHRVERDRDGCILPAS
jgi:hypothetical protein